MNRCDVVIVNFSTGEFLTAAVESVLRSRSVALVYIVDNASNDGSLDFLPHGHDDRLTIINNTANLVENMPYESYRSLIAKAKWSLTFGEGLDGYFAEMAWTGGIPAVSATRIPRFRDIAMSIRR